MSFSPLTIIVNHKGATSALAKFTGSAHNAGRATEKLERGTKNLAVAFATLGGVLGTRQLVEYADTWTLINSRIKIVTESHEQAKHVQQELYNISQRTRNSLAATGVLYVRLAINADQLGRSQQDLLDVVSAVNSAVLVSGATGVEAAQSIRQISQAFGKGKLDGDEFRTVMEAMPLIQRAIADEMDVPIGALQDLAQQGKITANIMIDAMLNARKQLEEDVESMPMTFGQAMVLMQNALTRVIGILNLAFEGSMKFATGVEFVIINLNRFIALSVAVIAALVAYKVATLAWVGTLALLKWNMDRATISTMLLTATETIQRMWKLATATVSTANAFALMSAFAGGAAKIIPAMVAAGAAIGVYIISIKKITAATEEWINAISNMDVPIGAFAELEEAKIQKARNTIKDMIREAHQGYVLSSQSAMGSKRLKIEFEAVNKIIEMRRDGLGDLEPAMYNAILLERDYALRALETVEAMEALAAIEKEKAATIKRFITNFQRGFADAFHNILTTGISNFTELFDGIKTLFYRLIADMVAAKMMQRLAGTFTTILGAVMGVSAEEAAAREKAAFEAVRASWSMGETGFYEAGTMPIRLEEISNTAAKSWTATLAQYLGPALAGFMVGRMIGGRTTNVALGTLGGAAGGALSGAAMGAMLPGVGGPLGAVIGGLTGAIGGLMGASERQREEMERLRAIEEAHKITLEENNLRLQELKRSFDGQTHRHLTEMLKILEYTTTEIFAYGLRGDTLITDTIGYQYLNEAQKAAVNRMADSLQVDLFDTEGNFIEGSLEQLNATILETIRQLTTFGNNLTDIVSRQEAYNKLFDIDMTPQQNLEDTYSVLSQMAPELLASLGLANLDLTSQVGRDVLEEGLREIFNLIDAGDLTTDLLGAFGDKNELLDSILKVKDGFNALNKEINKVTTDFPRAMDIIYYEQKFGQYGLGNNGNGGSGGGGSGSGGDSWTVNGGVHIHTDGSETGEEIFEKIEQAATRKRARGGRVGIADTELF